MTPMVSILPNSVVKFLKTAKQSREWRSRSYSSPAPQNVKESVLLKYSLLNTQWIETGTYLGHTTQFLAKMAPKVYTVEPSEQLHKKAKQALKSIPQIECILGTSEDVFPDLLPKLNGNCNFWLDGHFSAGVTFKGKSVCPVMEELAAIGENLPRLGEVVIFIDDVRLFCDIADRDPEYPSIDALAKWAIEKNLAWTIEHDIFICRN